MGPVSDRDDILGLWRITAVRGRLRVIDDVTVQVAPGEIVAVIGPNGAGKTSLLEAVIGAIPLASGEVRVGSQTLRGLEERARCFHFLSGEAEPPAEVPVRTLLDHAAFAPGADRGLAAGLRDRLGLRDLGKVPAGALSRGERRRILLFAALVSAKPFLLLDEPTGVFDPLQLLDVVKLFRESATRGTGLVVTVHQMSDAEALASRVLLLDEGKALACDSLDNLRARAALPGGAPLQQVFLALLRGQGKREDETRAPS
jgi:Cu-processing system ATP-binding protein